MYKRINQYTFEVIRDLIPLIQELKKGETVTINITRHKERNIELLDIETSKVISMGLSDVSERLRQAYEKNN